MRGLEKKFTITSTGASPVASYDSDDWQARDDARTLTDAEKIKMHPERHAKAKGHLKAQMAAVRKAAGAPGPAPKDSAADMVAKGYRKL